MNLLTRYESVINELKTYPDVETILLFGSYATNNIKPLSDLDICIITKKKAPKSIQRTLQSYGNDELDISLFHTLPLSLQYKILHEGKILYTTKDISTLKIKITNQWFDFRHTLNKLYKSRGYKPIEME